MRALNTIGRKIIPLPDTISSASTGPYTDLQGLLASRHGSSSGDMAKYVTGSAYLAPVDRSANSSVQLSDGTHITFASINLKAEVEIA